MFRTFLLLTALWALTLAGIQSVPLEKHEGFVLASAQEMKSGGDWIVPRFNDDLRLQKPPLNYWATLLVSALDPFTEEIQIYHGRLVSMLAGLLMVLLTALAGTRLYDRKTGLTAALLLLCTNGFLHLSHNARPDFLYAAFCTLQLFSWAAAWKTGTPSHRKWLALAGWAAAGLATLTKGPQVPFSFLLGFTLFLAAGPDRRRILNILCPFSGTAIFCLLALPWWVLLQQRLKLMGADITDGQVSGSLLSNLAGWKELFSLYYLWMSAVQMLPASLLLFFLFRPGIRNRTVLHPSTRLLICAASAMLIVFTLGGHYRKHYVLPLLPVFSILLTCGLHQVRFPGFERKWIRFFIAAGTATGAVCAGLMIWKGAYIMPVFFAGLSLLIIRLLKQELADTFGETPVFVKQLPVLAAALILLGAGLNAYLPVSPWRAAEQKFSENAGRQISENDRLVCWKTSVGVIPFYARQPVGEFTDRNELLSFVAAHHAVHPVFAVLPLRELPDFNSLFETRLIQTAENTGKPAKSLGLVEILRIKEALCIIQ